MKMKHSMVTTLALGLFALMSIALTGCATSHEQSKQTTPDDTIKTRTAYCNCGQLRVTCVGPAPERISLC